MTESKTMIPRPLPRAIALAVLQGDPISDIPGKPKAGKGRKKNGHRDRWGRYL